MLRHLYDKVIALSASRHALPALAAVSFAESSFFPGTGDHESADGNHGKDGQRLS